MSQRGQKNKKCVLCVAIDANCASILLYTFCLARFVYNSLFLANSYLFSSFIPQKKILSYLIKHMQFITRYGRNPNCTLDISLSFFNVLYGITSINKLQIFHSLTALCSYLNCASTIASNYKIPQKGASNCLRKNEISFIFMKHNDSYFSNSLHPLFVVKKT